MCLFVVRSYSLESEPSLHVFICGAIVPLLSRSPPIMCLFVEPRTVHRTLLNAKVDRC